MSELSELLQELTGLARDQRTLTALRIRQAKRELVRDDASGATFTLITSQGNQIMVITALPLRVGGDPAYVEITPKKADGSVDPSVENVIVTIDGSTTGDAHALLEPYGDGSNALRFKVSAIASDAGDAIHNGNIHVKFDSATDVPEEVQNVELDLPFTVTAENAVTAEFATIAPPA